MQHTCGVVQASKLTEVASAVEHLSRVQGTNCTGQQDVIRLHHSALI